MRILLVEDIEMMRDALERSLAAAEGIEIVAALSSAARAAALCESLKPDIALMDICAADKSSGIDAAAEIKARCPQIKIVLMTAFSDMTFEKRAQASGAESFIYKDIGTAELVEVLHRTMSGERVYPEKRPAVSFESCSVELTDRETEVLRLMCKGLTNNEIAMELKISEHTVVTHINNLRGKTGITKKSKLIAYAVEQGYIIPSI